MTNIDDSSITNSDGSEPTQDPAQAEWDQTGDTESTATGADPAEIPDDEDEVPAADLPTSAQQPESQGEDPVVAELGDDGQGDLSPGDL